MSALAPEINAVIDGYVADLKKAKDENERLREAIKIAMESHEIPEAIFMQLFEALKHK